MPLLHTKQESAESARLRSASIIELEKLVEVARERGETLATISTSRYLTNIDIMLLDSAFKGFDLEKADKTLLILKDRYLNMIHKLIWVLIQTLCDSK